MLIPENVDTGHVIFAMIFFLSNKLQAVGDTFFKEITTKQWFIALVLNILSDRGPTLNELSDAAGSSHQNVKQIILKLESKGFVELKKDDADARKFRIKMTPKCLEYLGFVDEHSKAFIKELYKDIDETDLEVTKQTMLKIFNNLNEMRVEDVRQ